jgi:uncharacterized membrane protein
MTPVFSRSASIDAVRGLIMILMALDHTRDFFGSTAIDPTNLARTSIPLFLTRWITHICAPVFFLLTGAGAALSLGRRTPAGLSWLLFTRGLWLIVLELTIVRCVGYQFNADYRVTFLLVLWALGWSMIVLSALVRLPPAVVAGVGIAIVALHNLLDGIQPASFGSFAPLWSILHQPGIVLATPRVTVFAAYPLVPWIGVTAVGYGLGHLYRRGHAMRPLLLRIGLAMIAAFVVLRWTNVYGDPAPWSAQRSWIWTVLSFVNTTKYPPSLLFLLMTLGAAALLLWAVHAGTPRVLQPAVIFGRVPLFYFVLHLALIHAAAVVVCWLRYGDAHWMFESARLDQYPFTQPPGWGYPLPIVYLAWLAVVAMLYPVCRWYAAVKQRRSDWWLSYL